MSHEIKHESQNKFCVWTKAGHRPAFFHATLEGATKEAERLAALQPGDKFIVMHVVDKVWAAPLSAQAALADVLEKASALLRDSESFLSTAMCPAYRVSELRNAVERARGAK